MKDGLTDGLAAGEAIKGRSVQLIALPRATHGCHGKQGMAGGLIAAVRRRVTATPPPLDKVNQSRAVTFGGVTLSLESCVYVSGTVSACIPLLEAIAR